MRARRLLLATLLAAACTDGPTSAVSDALLVRADADGLTLHNRTDRPVFFVAAERETWSLLDLYPCDGPTTCPWPQVAPHASARLPYSRVSGYRRGVEVLVRHQSFAPRPDGAGYRPEGSGTVVVRAR